MLLPNVEGANVVLLEVYMIVYITISGCLHLLRKQQNITADKIKDLLSERQL
jgi:hypothetical protein